MNIVSMVLIMMGLNVHRYNSITVKIRINFGMAMSA